MSVNLLSRRVVQIEGHLARMGQRILTGAGPSFIVFDERPTKRSKCPRGMQRLKKPRRETIDKDGFSRLAWWSAYGNDPFKHYIQFAFDEGGFRVDLPEDTLHPDEAERLLAERQGFYWVRPRQQGERPSPGEFGPLNKNYGYGDERQAAGDALFLIVEIWRFSPSFRWYVKSSPFKGGDYWELGEPLA